MSLIEINHNPEPRELRTFAIAWVVVLSAVGLVIWLKHGTCTSAAIATVAAWIPLLMYVVSKPALRCFFVALCYAVAPIGFAVSTLLLMAVYYLVITPIGLIIRLFGHDSMRRRFDPDAKSYWTTTDEQEEESRERYLKQY